MSNVEHDVDGIARSKVEVRGSGFEVRGSAFSLGRRAAGTLVEDYGMCFLARFWSALALALRSHRVVLRNSVCRPCSLAGRRIGGALGCVVIDKQVLRLAKELVGIS